MKCHVPSFFALSVSALAVSALIATAAVVAVPREAKATAGFAQETGKACNYCHTSPAGGALNANGKKFKANGNKL